MTTVQQNRVSLGSINAEQRKVVEIVAGWKEQEPNLDTETLLLYLEAQEWTPDRVSDATNLVVDQAEGVVTQINDLREEANRTFTIEQRLYDAGRQAEKELAERAQALAAQADAVKIYFRPEPPTEAQTVDPPLGPLEAGESTPEVAERGRHSLLDILPEFLFEQEAGPGTKGSSTENFAGLAAVQAPPPDDVYVEIAAILDPTCAQAKLVALWFKIMEKAKTTVGRTPANELSKMGKSYEGDLLPACEFVLEMCRRQVQQCNQITAAMDAHFTRLQTAHEKQLGELDQQIADVRNLISAGSLVDEMIDQIPTV